MPFRLGLLLLPDCMPAGLFATADLVRACNRRATRERVSVVWLGLTRDPVPTHDGPALCAQECIGDAPCDAVLLPGLWLESTDRLQQTLHMHAAAIAALRALPPQTQLWSYCTGVALAAAASRLDDEPATTTWWLQPALAAAFPRANWSGALQLAIGRHAVTASGANGHLPLMLDRLTEHFPAHVLGDVEELLMLHSPRARHSAFRAVEMMALREPVLRTLLLWVQRTPAQALLLDDAARQLNVSVRTLCRQVQRTAGMAAGEWLRLAKLAQAGEALRGTRTPIKRISERLGFGSEASLHRAFKNATGLTPSDYRLTHGEQMRTAQMS